MEKATKSENIRDAINNATKTSLREMAKDYANQLTLELLDKGTFNEEIDKIKAITKQKINKRIVIPKKLTKSQLKLVTYNLHQQLEKESDADFKYQQSRNTFLQDRKSYTKEMWKEVTNILGSLGDELAQYYGSNNIISDYENYATGEYALTEMEILETIEKAIKENKGKTQEELVDASRKKLNDLRIAKKNS